eukprot:COSAG02_NODE_1345_length_13143_cov_61.223091_6_plen_130_part_00
MFYLHTIPAVRVPSLSLRHSACRAHSGSAQHLKHSDENDALSPKDIGPFGKPTIFSRTAARTEPRNRDDQAAEPKAEDATAPQLDDNSMAGDAAGGAKGISATVESCIVILTAIAMGGARNCSLQPRPL